LQDTLWTRGKCGYKILQCMGVALPVVASPVGINGELVRHGETGFLAREDRDWKEALEILAADPGLRARMGIAGRAAVVTKYSLASYMVRYEQILRGLVEAGRGERDRKTS
jgi:glycosyltransferase involved in cell wall biosynthesis